MKKYFISGVFLTIIGFSLFFLPADQFGDKDAYFVKGHWMDVFWEVQLPLLLFGFSLIAIAVIRKKMKAVEKNENSNET